MKKHHIGLILVALVVTILLSALLVACGDNGETSTAQTTSSAPESTTEAVFTSTKVEITTTKTEETSTKTAITTTEVIITSTETVVTSTETVVTSTEAVVTTVVITTAPETIAQPDAFIIYSIEMLGRYGDATIIKYGDFEILVDGGTSSDTASVQKALAKHVTDRHLDMLIVSHPDADHIDGIEKLSTFSAIDSIGMIVQNGDTRGNADFNNTVVSHFSMADSKSITEIMADRSLRTVKVDDAFSITFLEHSYYYDETADKNDKSIAFIVEFENTVLFMGGDMESASCNSLMQMNPDLVTEEQFVIFKALHHGSKGTNKDAFLSYIKPDLAFVSAGMQLTSSGLPNYSSHPYPEAISRIAAHTTRIYWSSLIGNTTITCDGEDATVTSEGRTKDYYYETKSESGTFLAKKEEEIAVTVFETRYYQMLIEYHGYPDRLNILKKIFN